MQKETGLASRDAVRLDLKAKIAGRPCRLHVDPGIVKDSEAVHSFLENEDVVDIFGGRAEPDTLIDAGLVL